MSRLFSNIPIFNQYNCQAGVWLGLALFFASFPKPKAVLSSLYADLQSNAPNLETDYS
jgi:hypothetical protein